MRPLRLEIEGFACYRERQVVDFDGLRLFTIAGPTGAGKSTLLDGIVFALFGQIPRVGGKGRDAFVAHGSDRLWVQLDFEALGGRWRVARRLRIGKAANVDLYQWKSDDWQSAASGAHGVDGRIAAMLGLGADAFLQSVVLPQGEFAKFLHSTATLQKRMLGALLRLDVYDDMAKAARAKVAAAQQEVATKAERLANELAGATEEALATCVSELASAAAARDEGSGRVAAAAAEASSMRAFAGAWKDHAAVVARTEAHARGAAAIQVARDELSAAERAGRAKPALDALAAANVEQSAAVGAATDASSRALTARERITEAAVKVDRAAASAAVVPDLRTRMEHLARAVADAGLRDAAVLRAAAEQRDVDRAERDRTAEEVVFARATGEHRARAEAAAQARIARDAVAYDPALLTRLRADRPRIEALRAARRSREALAASAGTAFAAVETARVDAERALSAAEGASSEARGARKRQAEVAEVARLARVAHAAHDLRSGLAAGDPCPVCAHPVGALPDDPAPEGLTAALAALSAAESAAAQATERSAQADARAFAAAADLDAAGRRAAMLREELGALDAELAPSIGAEATFDAALAAQEAAERAFGEADRAWRDHVLDAERLSTAVQASNARLAAVREREATHRSRASAAREEADEVAARIRDLVGELADPRAERESVRRRIDALTSAAADATAAHAAATRDGEQAVADEQRALARGEAARAVVERGEQAVVSALAEAGFPTVATCLAAVRERRVQDALRAQIAAWDQEAQGLAAQAAALRPRLGDRPVTELDAALAESRAADAQRALSDASARVGELTAQHAALVRNLAAANVVRAEHATALARQTRYAALLADLGPFKDHLLYATFDELVRGASDRLLELSSDRYSLDLPDGSDEMVVVDHDNARAARPTKTLSGGETFLASLALALELSALVQRAAGAVRLDSLFIDEGFGTLDPETLETVAAALDELAGTDRMVGIITHVSELTSRLGARIEVHKGPSGSTVKVVR